MIMVSKYLSSSFPRPSPNISLIGRGISKIEGRRELSPSLPYVGRFRGVSSKLGNYFLTNPKYFHKLLKN